MKRIVSALMSVLLVFSCIGVSVAASFPDIETDWAINEIEYMVSKGILNGYPEDGTFKPTRIVTRAEFIKMMCETFGLSATTTINYSDVKSGDWYYPYIQRAAAQGFLLNYGASMNPNGQLSRQEAAALLVRYLDLDPDNAAPSSTYPDFSKIKLSYRDYVLQATYEGLFKGRDNGNFDPDATLQRREAAAILHRAVGTIFRGSQEGTDLTAAAGNGVITKSNVTVRDARITDRLIITEGASGGKVVLEDCDIGELIIRGTATVDLDDTDVKKIIVDSAVSGATTYITMSSGLDIGEVQLKTPGRIEVSSRTVIGKLTVEKDAKNSSATGYGVVEELYVDADGFEADKVPTTYELASGVTAHFDGIKYSGSSTTAANTGFTEVPSSYASASSCFLTSTSIANGTLYYYFTSNATAPSKTTFDSFHEASAVKGSYTVAKTTMDKNVATAMASAAYPYIIVMLRDNNGNSYDPLVISNRASSGFSVAPEVSTSNSYHYLAYTPTVGGTLYYYYTNNSDVPTVSSFSSTYTANSTSYKGTVDVSAGKSASSVLLSTSRVSNYAYIAVMLEEKIGENYQPVLVPAKATVSSLGNGFSSTPKCTLTADGIALSYNAANTGTLQYYFSSSNVEPSAAQFDTNLALADTAMTGAATVTAGKSATLMIGKNVSASSYPYVVLRLTSGTTRYNPVVVSTSGVALDLTGTGFNAVPTVSVANGYFYLTPNTSYSSRVYYYMTNSTSVANADVFLRNYENSVSSYLASKTGGYITTSSFSSAALQTNLAATTQTTYKYLALMMSVNGQNYKPIVVPLAKVDITQIEVGDLFLAGPMYSVFTVSHQIDFTARKNGNIFYYYTDSKDEELDVDSIIANALFGAGNNNHKVVTANKAEYIVINDFPEDELPEFIAIIFQDDVGNIYEPIYLKTDGTSGYSMASTGFAVTPTVSAASTASGYPTLSFSTMEYGTIYYYFTNSTNYTPTTVNAFFSMYNSSTLERLRGTLSTSIGRDSQSLYTISNPSGYPYVVVMFQNAEGGTGGYYKPVCLRVGGGSTGGGSSYMQEAFNSTPYLNGYSLYYNPAVTGTLYYSYSDTNDINDWLEMFKIGAVAGASNYNELSGLLVSIGKGGKTTVTSTGSSRSLTLTVDTTEKYLTVWMVTTAGTLTSPKFILTSSSGSGYPGTGTGTGSSSITANGFVYDPFQAGDSIAFRVPYSGVVKYVFTNSTESNVTNTTFDTAYGSYYTSSDSITISDSSIFHSFDIPVGTYPYSTSYKYVWIQYTTYFGFTYDPVVRMLEN